MQQKIKVRGGSKYGFPLGEMVIQMTCQQPEDGPENIAPDGVAHLAGWGTGRWIEVLSDGPLEGAERVSHPASLESNQTNPVKWARNQTNKVIWANTS
jgi:hypothetical protein